MGIFNLFVDDNYHFTDQDERYKAGTYSSYAEAVAAAQGIIDAWLNQSYHPEMNSEDLYKGYTMYGEDPYILEEAGEEPLEESSGREHFSAWEYAKKRCDELCKANN